MKDALQALNQDLREWRTATQNATPTNRKQNFQPRKRGFGFCNQGFQNRGNRTFDSRIICQTCGLGGHHSSVCWRSASNN